MSLEIIRTTKKGLPAGQAFFVKIAKAILGSKYELSLVLVGDKKARALNQKYRQKNYVPNILSFPIDKAAGEIFINPNRVEKERAEFEKTYRQFFIFLFIHGCLHLKGFDHGPQMEKEEEKYLKKFLR